MNIMYSGFLPLGMAVFGPLADAVPMRLLMVVSGGLLSLLAAALRADKRFRAKGTAVPSEEQESQAVVCQEQHE